MKKPTYRALVHASEVLTGAGIRKKDGRHPEEKDLGRIPDGAVVYSVRKAGGKEIPDRVEWVGPTSKVPPKFRRAKRRDLRGRQAVIPGLVDCHTHLVFAGERADEFAARCGGATYEEIAAKGGGIVRTMKATREATPAELERLAVARVQEARSFGVRTLEIKSGYGLNLAAERKQLEVIPKLKKRFPDMTFTATFLGAHAFPPGADPEEYVTEICEEMLPEITRLGLADACDVFVDQGYFTLAQAERILTRAKGLGLKTKIHADELFPTGSAELAVELGALSADHLLKISELGVKRLADSGTVAVLLPGTAFYLKAPHAPARKLLSAGARVALSTDFNPGSSVTLHLPAILTIAALYLGMTRAELFAAVTYNGARALGLQSRKGTLEPGKDADFWVMPFARFEDCYYRFAWSAVT